MGKMAGDQHIARLAAQAIADPFGAIVRLQIGGGTEWSKRIASSPEFLRRLPGAQLAAVPDDLGMGRARGRRGGDAHRVRRPCRRQRTTRVDVGTNGISVMDEE